MGELTMMSGRFFANFMNEESRKVRIALPMGIRRAEAEKILIRMEKEAWALRRQRVSDPGKRRRFIRG